MAAAPESVVESVDARAYTIPTDTPEAVAAATPNLRHLEWFHDHVRIESIRYRVTP
jgi:hypothetical protein